MAILTQSRSICLTMTRLRRGAIVCCWLVGFALACQVVIWSLATYTELRYETVEVAHVEQPLIVDSMVRAERRGRVVQQPEVSTPAATEQKPQTQMILSAHDRRFQELFSFAGGVGRLAMIVLVVTLGLGVVFGASGAVAGAERSVAAFLAAVVVALLVLPFGRAMDLPWEDGALTSYERMSAWVDQIDANRTAGRAEASAGDEAASVPSTILFYARFLLLPAACVVGLVLVGLRFSTAVEAATLQRESGKLDPAVEREASNVSPSSLHGGRTSSILTRTIGHASDAAPKPGTIIIEDEPQVDSPKRLI